LAATVDIPLEDWKRVIEVNTIGVWLSMKVQMKQMFKQESIEGIEPGRVEQRGSIVNAASVNSMQGGAGVSGYTAAKHAVVGLTKAGALEARGLGVRVNCVSPGFLLTKLLEPAMKVAEGQTSAALSGDAWASYEARQGRKASFEEVGDVVAMMCSPRMSLVVGHNLVIDGGFTINENAA
jgi:NAD(P)-dependent dehydrogenase (short-subunit alcohol dehydrogenase family)